jgi:hypothetical protein
MVQTHTMIYVPGWHEMNLYNPILSNKMAYLLSIWQDSDGRFIFELTMVIL